MHGLGEERGEDAHKGFDFWRVREVFSQLLHVSEQMSIAILNLNRGLVVSIIAVDH
jgi:hypothetical protein